MNKPQQKFAPRRRNDTPDMKVGDIVSHMYDGNAKICIVGVPQGNNKFFFGTEGVSTKKVPYLREELVQRTPEPRFEEDEFGRYQVSEDETVVHQEDWRD